MLAQPFEFVAKALSVLQRMDAQIELRLIRHGFYL